MEKEYLMHLCGPGGNGSCAIYLSAHLLLQPPLWAKGSKSTMTGLQCILKNVVHGCLQGRIELYTMEYKQPNFNIGTHLKCDCVNCFFKPFFSFETKVTIVFPTKTHYLPILSFMEHKNRYLAECSRCTESGLPRS